MAKNMDTPAAPGSNARFEKLAPGCYSFGADGCTNSGVIVGERGIMIVGGQATPTLAKKAMQKVREVSDQPIKVVVLTHFHADGALGATGFKPWEIIGSDLTRRMLDTRGANEVQVSRHRSPEMFAELPANASLTMPTMSLASSMTVDLGGIDVRLMHLGRGHTMGDLVAWVPSTGVLFAGDLIQTSAASYCGDAHLADWPRALDRIAAFRPKTLVPGRGDIARDSDAVLTAIETTRTYLTTLQETAAAQVTQGVGLRETYLAVYEAMAPQFADLQGFDLNLPFNVARAYDEALGLDLPQEWSLERVADLKDAIGVEGLDLPEVPSAAPEGELAAELQTEVKSTADIAVADEDASGVVTTSVVPEAESEAGQLVSDSDFAASLALLSEEEGAAEADGDAEVVTLPDVDDQGTEAESPPQELLHATR